MLASSFKSSVITRYCVERRVPLAGDWADYVSFDDNEVGCENWIDRCIGRLDLSPCHLSDPSWQTGDGFLFPECSCSSASLERSAREVGRLPIYSPMPTIGTAAAHSPPRRTPLSSAHGTARRWQPPARRAPR